MIKEKIIQAYIFAKSTHEGQMRKFRNVPYFVHPKSVARLVEKYINDEDMIIAALLHDTVEDCGVKLELITEKFGKNVSNLVYELTSNKEEIKKTNKIEYLCKKMNLMSEDALTIKLIDRLDNVMYLDKDCKTKEQLDFVKKYYTETKEILQNLGFETVTYARKINKLQDVLIKRIYVELELLEIQYKW